MGGFVGGLWEWGAVIVIILPGDGLETMVVVTEQRASALTE